MELNRLLKAAGVAAATLGISLLAGCSSSSTTSESSAPASETAAASSAAASDTASAAASDTASASASAEMTGPIVVEPGTTEVAAKVGQSLDFKVAGDPTTWKITTSNPEVLAVSQGGKQGDAVMNPGAEAILIGEATVVLSNSADSSTWEVKVSVTE